MNIGPPNYRSSGAPECRYLEEGTRPNGWRRNLDSQACLTPVNDPTDWVSSMVTVVKPYKSLKIGIDPKDLIRVIKRSHYPMPTIEELTTKLSNAKVFSVLDTKSGFRQIKRDEESCIFTAFNAPFGRFWWLRLPFDICSASQAKQRGSQIKDYRSSLNWTSIDVRRNQTWPQESWSCAEYATTQPTVVP